MSEGRRKKAIDSIINALTSEDLILSYPNFEKEFHLTTDASNVAIGAVLCQEGRPKHLYQGHYQKKKRDMPLMIEKRWQ